MRSVAIFGIGAVAGIVGVISYKLDADQLALVLMVLGLAVICGVALVAMAAIQIRGSVERERIAASHPAQPAQLPPPLVVMLPSHQPANPALDQPALLARRQLALDGHGVQVVRQQRPRQQQQPAQPGRGQVVQDGHGVQVVRQQRPRQQPARRPRQWGYVDHE